MNILIFTSGSVGYKCLKFLLNNYKEDNYDIFITNNKDSTDKIIKIIDSNKSARLLNQNKLSKIVNSSFKYDWILNLWGSNKLNKKILSLSKDSLNIHPSYLPYARGRDPVVWTLKYNYPAGISLHKISDKIDEGEIIFQKKIPYTHPIPAFRLYNQLIEESVKFFCDKWSDCRNNNFKYLKQNKQSIQTFVRTDLFDDEVINITELDTAYKLFLLQLPNNYSNLDQQTNLRSLFLQILRHDFQDKFYAKILINKKYYKANIQIYENSDNFDDISGSKIKYNNKFYKIEFKLIEILKPEINNYKVYIHIGGHKTASTLLQRRLFNQDDFSFVGNECNDYNLYKESIHSLIENDDSSFNLTTIKKNLNSKFRLSNNIKIFSCEDIVSSTKLSLVAKRLKSIYPNSKIIFVIRNQIDAITSLYLSHGAYLKNVPKKYWRNYVSFDDWINYLFDFPSNSYLQCFDYYTIYKTLLSNFNDSDIHLLVYEETQNANDNFFNKLGDILDYDKKIVKNIFKTFNERKGPSNIKFFAHKLLSNNSITKNLYNYLDKNQLLSGKTYNFKIDDNMNKKIFDYYKASNKKLNETRNLDLKKYNYPI